MKNATQTFIRLLSKPFSEFSLGNSLIGVLVAVAILGALSIQVTTFMSNAFLQESDLRARSDKQQLRRWVESNISCLNTLSNGALDCSGTTYIDLRDGNDNIIIKSYNAADFTRKANFFGLRAQCVPCATCPYGRKILVEVAQFKSMTSTDFRLNALTKKIESWTDLMGGIPVSCVIP